MTFFGFSPLETTAAILGFLCVYLAARQSILNFPVAIAATALYIFIFFEAKLYSDMILQFFFIGFQVYGWYHWLHGRKDSEELPVTKNPMSENLVWFLIGTFGSVFVGFIMISYTDASFPFLDSIILVFSLIAQWMLSVKKIENWILWIAIDALAIGIYYAKELHPTSILYALYLILAVIGYFQWKKSMVVKQEN